MKMRIFSLFIATTLALSSIQMPAYGQSVAVDETEAFAAEPALDMGDISMGGSVGSLLQNTIEESETSMDEEGSLVITEGDQEELDVLRNSSAKDYEEKVGPDRVIHYDDLDINFGVLNDAVVSIDASVDTGDNSQSINLLDGCVASEETYTFTIFNPDDAIKAMTEQNIFHINNLGEDNPCCGYYQVASVTIQDQTDSQPECAVIVCSAEQLGIQDVYDTLKIVSPQATERTIQEGKHFSASEVDLGDGFVGWKFTATTDGDDEEDEDEEDDSNGSVDASATIEETFGYRFDCEILVEDQSVDINLKVDYKLVSEINISATGEYTLELGTAKVQLDVISLAMTPTVTFSISGEVDFKSTVTGGFRFTYDGQNCDFSQDEMQIENELSTEVEICLGFELPTSVSLMDKSLLAIEMGPREELRLRGESQHSTKQPENVMHLCRECIRIYLEHQKSAFLRVKILGQSLGDGLDSKDDDNWDVLGEWHCSNYDVDAIDKQGNTEDKIGLGPCAHKLYKTIINTKNAQDLSGLPNQEIVLSVPKSQHHPLSEDGNELERNEDGQVTVKTDTNGQAIVFLPEGLYDWETKEDNSKYSGSGDFYIKHTQEDMEEEEAFEEECRLKRVFNEQIEITGNTMLLRYEDGSTFLVGDGTTDVTTTSEFNFLSNSKYEECTDVLLKEALSVPTPILNDEMKPIITEKIYGFDHGFMFLDKNGNVWGSDSLRRVRAFSDYVPYNWKSNSGNDDKWLVGRNHLFLPFDTGITDLKPGSEDSNNGYVMLVQKKGLYYPVYYTPYDLYYGDSDGIRQFEKYTVASDWEMLESDEETTGVIRTYSKNEKLINRDDLIFLKRTDAEMFIPDFVVASESIYKNKIAYLTKEGVYLYDCKDKTAKKFYDCSIEDAVYITKDGRGIIDGFHTLYIDGKPVGVNVKESYKKSLSEYIPQMQVVSYRTYYPADEDKEAFLFAINDVNLDDITWTMTSPDNVKAPSSMSRVECYEYEKNNITLKMGSEFDVTLSSNATADRLGMYFIIFNGKGTYEGTQKATIVISAIRPRLNVEENEDGKIELSTMYETLGKVQPNDITISKIRTYRKNLENGQNTLIHTFDQALLETGNSDACDWNQTFIDKEATKKGTYAYYSIYEYTYQGDKVQIISELEKVEKKSDSGVSPSAQPSVNPSTKPSVSPSAQPSVNPSTVPQTQPAKQTIKVAKALKKTVTYQASILKDKKATIKLNAKAKTKLSYKIKKGNKKYISVSKKGVVTLKKGCKKGTYKVAIIAKADKKYKKTTKTVTIKVK